MGIKKARGKKIEIFGKNKRKKKGWGRTMVDRFLQQNSKREFKQRVAAPGEMELESSEHKKKSEARKK